MTKSTKNKITAENILKVIDVRKDAINSATWHFLNNFFIAFKDNCLKEHLINIYDAIDETTSAEPMYLPQNSLTKTIIEEVRELHELCNIHDAGYVRFVEL